MNLYHILLHGDRLRDGVLYTLSDLKIKHPDLYELQVAKYHERPHILEQRFPHLGCGWSDVVFLCPVHPEEVITVLVGDSGEEFPPLPFQVIPVADLDPARLGIWLFRNRTFDPAEVIPFDPALLKQVRDIPAATLTYLEEQRAKKEPALCFVHIPHVLYKGSLDMSAYPVHYTSGYWPPT